MTSSNKTVKAIIATIKLGSQEFQGLMLPDGSFGLGVSQLAHLNLVRHNQASRDLKPILGESFQFDKITSELNSKPINYVTVAQFELILRHLDRQGNQAARDIVDSLVGLSLTQLFSDGFGIKLESEDRQIYLIARQKARKAFRPNLTDSLKEWYQGHDSQPDYGYEVNRFKKAIGTPLKPIDEYSAQEMETWKDALIQMRALTRLLDDPHDCYDFLLNQRLEDEAT